jgi:hypothetical protein
MAKAKTRSQSAVPSAKRPARNAVSYRCPGCGQEVDGTDRAAVSMHHQHVLHPHLFQALHRTGYVR